MRGRGRRTPPTAREPDSADAAYAEAIKRLARQPQSRAALGKRLSTLGYRGDAIGEALERAEANGYLNDPELAASLIRRRAASRGHSLIARELRAKGIEAADAGSALAALDPEAEAEQALALGRRLLERYRPEDPERLRAIVGPRLSRRGFSSGLVYRICRQLSDEWQAAGRFDRV